MNATWQVRLYESLRLMCEHRLDGPVELGRQKATEKDGPFTLKRSEAGRWRLVIAPLGDNGVPRDYALIEPLPAGRAVVTALSPRLGVQLPGVGEIKPGDTREVPLPVLLTAGRLTVRFEEAPEEPSALEGLGSATVPPGRASSRRPAAPLSARDGADAEAMVRWLQAAMDVMQSAAGSLTFFAEAARAVVDLVGLDCARVLLLEGGAWAARAVQAGPRGAGAAEGEPSSRLLSRLLAEKQTFRETPTAAAGGSLQDVRAVVAAPILSREGEVIGALYGDRVGEGPARPITRLEAMLVELLARGVAAGLARLEQEGEVLRARVQFEQFFTRELSQQLALEPDLLRGRDEEVSILFCDIRAFSRISERLGPARTVEWVGEVMGMLSECVLAHHGVLIDYIGDELIAMWGAPQRQEDHAQLACRAALDMLAGLPALDDRWGPALGEPLKLGIGVNTGVARVGNVGTERKFKYGPLGNTVNLASRVQGATKYLKAGLLITGATQARLKANAAARRLRRVRVVNIGAPVDLYELADPARAGWAELRAAYEQALDQFEKGQFRLAARTLAPLVSEEVNDGPSLLLMAQAVRNLVDEPAEFDPVWDLPGK